MSTRSSSFTLLSSPSERDDADAGAPSRCPPSGHAPISAKSGPAPMVVAESLGESGLQTPKEATMHGTLLCAVTDGAENDDAVAQAVALSERLGLRLVLAHVVDRVASPGDGDESVTMRGDHEAAERELAELAQDHQVSATADRRVVVGDPSALLAQIAGEEAADVIVVGAR